MKIARILALATFAAGVVLGAGAGNAQKIKIATEGAYAPWNLVNTKGQLEGFEIDLAKELCKRANLECEIVQQDWDGIIPSLLAKKYDVIMAGMNITPKRKEAIDFSLAYAGGPHGFMALKGSDLEKLPGGEANLTKDEKGAEELIAKLKPMMKGKVIGAQGSTTNSNFAEKYFKDVAEIRLYKTTEQHDLDLAAGRVDVLVANHSAFRATMDTPTGKDMVIVGPAFSGGLLGLGVACGVRKEDTALRDKLSAAIDAAKKDGTIKTISMKWFKIDMTPKG